MLAEAPRIALVTDARKGVGYEIARQVGRQGAVVLLGARNQRSGEEAASALAAEGLTVRYIHLDLSDPATIEASAATIEADYGHLDVLVNTAGSSRSGTATAGPSACETARTTTDQVGIAALSRAMAPLLRSSDSGRIVNVARDSRLPGDGDNGRDDGRDDGLDDGLDDGRADRAAQAALGTLTADLARALENTGITVAPSEPRPGAAAKRPSWRDVGAPAGRQETPRHETASRIWSLQILRAAAALAVVLYHATVLWADKARGASVYVWENGNAGVDLFFVISGFIILVSGRRFAKRPGGAWRFFELRLIRLVPIYWLATTIKLVTVMLAPATSLVNGKPSLWNAVASYLFIPSTNGVGNILPVLPVGWTLPFEMFFYVLFAAALAFAVDPFLFIVPPFGLFAALYVLRTPDWPAFTAMLNPLLVEFVLGMLIGHLHVAGWLRKLPTGLAWALMLGGLVALAIAPAPDLWPRVICWGPAAGCTLVGAILLDTHLRGRIARFLVLLGEASYSLYLTQSFVLPIVGFAVVRMNLSGLALGMTAVAASLVLSSALALATYRYVERPMMNALRRFADERRDRNRIAAMSPAASVDLGLIPR